jgi:hypothetical protein
MPEHRRTLCRAGNGSIVDQASVTAVLFDESTFDRLRRDLTPMSDAKIYAPGRASVICPLNDDPYPLLSIRGRRFDWLVR